MYRAVAQVRALLGRYPRLVWSVLDLMSRIPGLADYFERRWNLTLPRRDSAPGYRQPLITRRVQLSGEARAMLDALERRA